MDRQTHARYPAHLTPSSMAHPEAAATRPTMTILPHRDSDVEARGRRTRSGFGFPTRTRRLTPMKTAILP